VAIKIQKLHYALRNKTNHSASEYLKKLTVAQVDYYLNEAIDTVLEAYYPKAEVNQEIREQLRPLEIKNRELPFTENSDHVIAKYPSDYYRRLRQYVIATNKCCEAQERNLIVRIVQSDDLSEILKSPNWQPSWDFEETVADESHEGLHIYKGDFDIKKVFIDYYRKPLRVAAPSLEKGGTYIDESGDTISQNQDFEIDSTFLWRAVVDVAALLVVRDYSRVENFQTQLQTILFKTRYE